MKFEIRRASFLFNEEIAKNRLLKSVNANDYGGYSVALNAEKIIRMYSDENFREIVQNAKFTVYDGVACKFWLDWWHVALTHDMRKVDFPDLALRIADNERTRVGVFAGRKQNVEILTQRLQAEYPNINFYFIEHGFHTVSEMQMILLRHNVQFCFLGVGSPLQERVAAVLARLYPNTNFLCVGGAFDIKLGIKRRAPQHIVHSNYEWLYRLVQEPRRLLRYTKILRIFMVILRFPVSLKS